MEKIWLFTIKQRDQEIINSEVYESDFLLKRLDSKLVTIRYFEPVLGYNEDIH